MSQTPRTDEEIRSQYSRGNTILSLQGFCRNLEIENSALQKRIEELEAIANHHQNKYLHAVSVYEDEVKWLEKQLLAMRESLKLTHDKMLNWFSSEYAAHPDTARVSELLNSSPSDLASKYSKREVLEKIKHYAAHMPSCECLTPNRNTGDCNCGFAEAIELARKELETK